MLGFQEHPHNLQVSSETQSARATPPTSWIRICSINKIPQVIRAHIKLWQHPSRRFFVQGKVLKKTSGIGRQQFGFLLGLHTPEEDLCPRIAVPPDPKPVAAPGVARLIILLAGLLPTPTRASLGRPSCFPPPRLGSYCAQLEPFVAGASGLRRRGKPGGGAAD